ncbi:luciferin sulfotransferase-like [Planococcus citri]|uniref:luciferin sulfotransferase-like n=1 Tax=Planococcus citri TaxID=170843 RepID=UPI0031F8016E
MAEEKFTYENLDSETNDLLLKYFTTPFRTGYIKCKGYVLPEYFREFGDRIRQMEIRDDDIWVCSFPKTGTTWTQEMVWCIGHNADLETAKEFLPRRFPFLEHSPLFDYRNLTANNPEIKFPPYVMDSIDYINKLPSPRFIKAHVPFELLPDKLQNYSTQAKIVYVARNPRDTCVSYYHHCKLLEGYKGPFDKFAQLFLEGNITFGPFFNHIKGYWKQRNNPNVLFLKYEEMKQDLKSVIYKTADFIEKSIDEEDVEKLLDHLSFSSMKVNRAVNYEPVIEINKKYKLIEEDGSFMRKGEIGEWKETMDSDLCERFEKWEKENLDEIDFTFSI